MIGGRIQWNRRIVQRPSDGWFEVYLDQGCQEMEACFAEEQSAKEWVESKKSQPDEVENPNPILHASAPSGMKCSECTIDKEPCWHCYRVWWEKRHPNTIFL